MNLRKLLNLTLLVLALQASRADVVETIDGARLTGSILGIDGGVVRLATDYAGELEIDQAKVASFTSDEAVYVRLESGTTMLGKVSGGSGGALDIAGPDGKLSTNIEKVSAGWQTASRDPELLRLEEAKAAAEKEAERSWAYELAMDVAGKKGNSDEFSAVVGGSATLASNGDKLILYGTYDSARKNGTKTSDEIIGGIDYTRYVKGRWGWFLREEIENDEFEDIDFRSTTGGGLTYRFFNEDHLKLEGRAGLSYRYESFVSGGTEESPGLDFGLKHFWKFADWGQMKNTLTWVPSIEDFSDYLFVQDSGIEIPLGLSDYWKVRFGLKNEYDSDPSPGLDNLDTAYYLRLLLSWD